MADPHKQDMAEALRREWDKRGKEPMAAVTAFCDGAAYARESDPVARLMRSDAFLELRRTALTHPDLRYAADVVNGDSCTTFYRDTLADACAAALEWLAKENGRA